MSRLTRNVAYNIAGQSVVAAATFVAARLIFRNVGGDAFGLIYFALSLNSLAVGMLDLGLSATVIRQVAIVHSRGQRPKGLLRTAGLASWGTAVVAASVAYLSADWLAGSWLHLTGDSARDAAALLRLLLPAALLNLPRSLYSSALRGLNRTRTVNVVDVSMAVVQQGGAAVVAIVGHNAYALGAWLAATFLLWTAIYALLVGRAAGAGALIPGFSQVAFRASRQDVGYLSLVSLLSVIHLETDKLAVSRLLSVTTFGAYSFASALVSRLTLVPVAVFQAVLPELAGESLYSEAAGRLSRVLKDRTLLVLIPLLAAAVFMATPLLGFVFGPSLARELLPAMAFIAVGEALNAAISVPYAYTVAGGRADIAARLNVIALVVVLPVAILLVRYFGVAGAGLSWVWYNVVAWVYFIPRYCLVFGWEQPWSWYKRTGALLAVAVLCYAAGLVTALGLGQSRTVGLIPAFGVASVPFLLLARRMVTPGTFPTAMDFARLRFHRP